MTRAFRTLLYTVDAHVATVTMNRPERKNAIGPEMANELVWALDDARDDTSVRVVVLTGAGNSFSAGGDLGGMSSGGESLATKGDFSDLLTRLTMLGKPVIARVPGPAMGGGCGLVASCTFAIAKESAELGTPELVLMVRESSMGADDEEMTNLVEQVLPLDLLFALLGDFSFPLPALYGIELDEGSATRDASGVYTGLEISLK